MEPDLNSILQEQLRGLHLPDAVSWWPPAPGWWILLVIVLLLLVLGVWYLLRKQRDNRYRKLALAELQTAHSQWLTTQNNSQYVQSASAIIKRAIIATGAHTSIASLTGQPWIQTINNWAKEPLSEQSSQALMEAGYRADPEVDTEELHQQLGFWLRSHRKPNVATVGTNTHKVNRDTAHA